MSSIRRSQRGFTLVEMMVSSVMAALFFGLLYGTFLPVMDVSSASSSKVDTLGAATTALYQIEADLRVATASSNGVSVGATPTAPQTTLGASAETTVLELIVPEKFANINDDYGQTMYDPATGLSDFETWVVYELISESGGSCNSTNPCDLYRTTWDTGSASKAVTQITASQLAAITATMQTKGRLLARNITSFQIANQTIACGGCNGPASAEVDVEMAAYATDTDGKVSQTSYQTQVFLRNN